ncbi:hypothetical protein [Microbacterium sp. APC 3901]|uniref:4'-phosphopantetheinyl transferase family protein n=1 Tax=Microbacterium sp. APC 3901 TaxID=3035192 RepID=UPI0025B381D0|nr:hypothetical protein [Microbacterium sp. APC 3901]MDN3443250.1 hypothetical protein [Microbacterium sp. APC 3901]
MGEITWRDVIVVWARPSDLQGFTETDVVAMGQRQVDRFRELTGSRAQGFLAGRALIRDLVGRIRGFDEIRLSSRCARCGADHGPPRSAGVSLSVSHAEDLVVVAATAGSALLGVDIEQAAADGRLDGLGRLFPDGSAPDLAAWTRIEAAVKADGRGFEIEPSEVLLHPQTGGEDPRVWSATLPGRLEPLEVTTLVGPPGHVLSVAVG